jgi:hypothetical protein
VPNPTARDVCERGATASTPKCGGARQGLAGASPGRRSRPPFRPRVGAKHGAGVCARDQEVKGGDRASPAAGTGRGRRGYSGELGEVLLCMKGRGIGQGLLLTACRRRRRAQKRREGAGEGTWQRRRSGRRSGVVGARLPRASGTGTCNSTCLISPWRSQESRGKSGGTNPSPAATNLRRRRGPEAATQGNWGSVACVGVLRVQREAQMLVCELK